MKFGLLSLAALAMGSDVRSTFVNFVKTYNKEYTVDEFFNRFEIFKSNMAMADDHNAKNLSWKMGVTPFADLTGEEFSKIYLGKVLKNPVEGPKRTRVLAPHFEKADPAFDWRTKGAVTPVRNQGQCGSCWAMTTVSAIESACYILTHNLTAWSTQALMDCSGEAGNQGCNGGYIDQSFKWIEAHPLPEDSCYPYTAASGTSCKKTCPPIKWCKVTGFKDVPKGDEAAMMVAVNKQPLALALEADTSFQMYTSGVIDLPNCGKSLDHTCLLIGYGTDSGKQYWTLQNTWGAAWGEKGYVRVIRNKDECGIADMVSYPTVSKA
jgi:C1A family cysteine protease